jgi:hypothetical protein
MLPAPRRKLPEISPIFISDKVTLHISREKDGKLRLGYAEMGRYEGRSAGWLRASSQRVEGVDPTPWHGKPAPPVKNRDPPGTPLF